MLDWIALFIATVFFTGFIPQFVFKKSKGGAGTIGSLVSLSIAITLALQNAPAEMILVMAVGSYLLGIVVMDRAEKKILSLFGPQLNHRGETVSHDFNQTCIDEVHGQFVAAIPVFMFPELELYTKIWLLVASMLLFRLFDIWKPGPIKIIEDGVPGPAGIMLDDTVAGLVSAAFVWLLILLIK